MTNILPYLSDDDLRSSKTKHFINIGNWARLYEYVWTSVSKKHLLRHEWRNRNITIQEVKADHFCANTQISVQKQFR